MPTHWWVFYCLLGVFMTEFQKITQEIRQLQVDINHLGSCTTKGLSTEQIAQLDERFFLAIEKLNWLKFHKELGQSCKI